MILASIEHAEADFAAALLIGARNEAEPILRATAQALGGEPAGALESEERERIESVRMALEEATQGTDQQLIRARMEELNLATQGLAGLVMDKALEGALKGKKAGVNAIALTVEKHLHLNMFGRLEILFQEHFRAAKSRPSFARG